MNKKTLDVLLDGEVISKETYENLRKMYPNHIPLNRVLGEESTDAFIGSGFSVKNTGLKRAKGSELAVEPVQENIAYNLEQAIIRAEKNKVTQTIENLFEMNKDKLKDVMAIRDAKVIGKTHEGIPIFEKPNDITTLQYYKDGKKKLIEFDDVRLKEAFDGMTQDRMGDILRVASAVTRMMSAMATRFSATFGIGNEFRDVGEAVVAASADGLGNQVLKNTPKSIKAVTDYVMGKSTKGAKLYEEMKRIGGTTGGLALSTKGKVKTNLKKLYELNDVTKTDALSKTKRGAEKLLNSVINGLDAYNTILEDSTRLSVYKAYRDAGYSKRKAAFAAKTATINFNKKGKSTAFLRA